MGSASFRIGRFQDKLFLQRVEGDIGAHLDTHLSMWKEFREFAVKGNVIDMAVGIIIGAAFGAIVTALVQGVVMPPIGLLLNGVDFSDLFILLEAGAVSPPYETLAAAQEAGAVVIAYGAFLNTVISFLIVAFAVFLVIKSINKMKREQQEDVAEAPVEPGLSAEQQLLTEIRDLLAART
ncbi:large-conductance mechanosensitive channel protein MscL [soil metagenome]